MTSRFLGKFDKSKKFLEKKKHSFKVKMIKDYFNLGTKNNKIISSVKETLESSSIHSIPNIVRNKYKSIKLVWFILFIISTGGFAYISFRSVISYLNFDVITKTEIKSMNKISFPMIRICNLNIFTTSYSKEKVNEILSLYKISPIVYEKPIFDQNNINNQSQFYIKYMVDQYLVISNIAQMNITEKRKIGLGLNEMLITCVYGLQPCKIHDFKEHYDFLHGICFLFNSGKDANDNIIGLKESSHTGIINGLNMEFFVGTAEEKSFPFSLFNGFSIYITNQNVLNAFTEGINISPGFSTNIIIEKTRLFKQPYPYSECTADLSSQDSYKSDVYKKLMSISSNYNQKSCQQICYQKHLGTRCGCQDPANPPFYSDLQLCLRFDLYTCNYMFFQEFLSSNSYSECDCPIECETTVLTYSTSLSEYPTISYAKSLLKNPEVLEKFNKTNVTFNDLRKNLASINIFYNDISEQMIEQLPKMELFDLIASIGGILGLFLGMSLLSFVEFIEIIMQSIFIWCEFRSHSKQVNQKTDLIEKI